MKHKDHTAHSSDKKLNRRKFFEGVATTGVSAAGTLMATQALAQACLKELTGAQPLGPFFPRPGTPAQPVREDPNPSTPVYLANDNDLTKVQGLAGEALGQAVFIQGKVMDKDCNPVEGARVIIWQASHQGRYNHNQDNTNQKFRDPRTGKLVDRDLDPNFQYWGKTSTAVDGSYLFKTIVPGYYPADISSGWYRPPHVHFLITAPGYSQLVTQMYFKGEKLKENKWTQELNGKDALLQDPRLTREQRNHLVVEFKEAEKGPLQGQLVGQFDLVLTR